MAKVPGNGQEALGGTAEQGRGRGGGQRGSGSVPFLPGVRVRDTQSRRSSKHEHSGEAGLDFTHSWEFLLVSFPREDGASQPDGVENAQLLCFKAAEFWSQPAPTSVSWYLMQRAQRSHHGYGLPCLPGVFGLGAMWSRTGALWAGPPLGQKDRNAVP